MSVLEVLNTEHPNPGDLLVSALRYATFGWQVFPLHSITRGPGDTRICTCGNPQCSSPAKHPRTENGFLAATTDLDQIKRWWTSWPLSNVGIRTGKASGLYVLDIDTPKGGAGTLRDLEAKHGELPATFTVLTGGGGWQFFFTHPGGDLPNSVRVLGPGTDTRGDGGYVAAPPSLHLSGRLYKVTKNLEIVPVPEWLLDRLDEARSARKAAPIDATTKFGAGERNNALASLAGTMRNRGMAVPAIYAALQVENTTRCDPPLADSEVRQIADSIGRYLPTRDVAAPAPSSADVREPVVFVVETFRELCDSPDPQLDELVGQILVRGYRTIIGGHTGEGKTTFALALIRAAVEGTEFLGYPGLGGCRALLIDAEQGRKTLKRRAREAHLEESDNVHILRVPDGLQLDTNSRQVDALEKILDDGRYDIVCADPLYKLHSGDSNDERLAVDLMRLFDRWRDEYQFAFEIPMHRRKQNQLTPGAFTKDDIFGSGAYTRGAEIVLGLQTIAPGCSKLHYFKDRDGDLPVPTSWRLLFNREDGYRRDPNDTKPGASEQIAAIRLADPGATQKTVASLMGVTTRTVKRYWHGADPAERMVEIEPESDDIPWD